MSKVPQPLLRDIRLAHLKQLAQLEVPPPRKAPTDDVPPEVVMENILSWIQDNPSALQAARDMQCTSDSYVTPNWDTVFFTFVESITMYLRKDKEVISALSAARAGDYDRALAHLDASQELILTVAAAIDCEFVQLCDFAEQTPDGTLYQSGAYAGLFISKASGKPFMGVGFKGTNSLRDKLTDLDWQPIVPPQPEILWGAPTHRGFYLALFGQFTTDLNSQVPFEVLVEQLRSVYTSDSRLHFTGHSLGGAFSALTYAEFLRRQEAETAFAQFALGDLYTYGGPRSSYEPFATELNKRTREGSGKHMFRIVNSQDPVPTIPPLFADDLINYPFIHARGAWRITVNGPEKMNEEPPPLPPLPVDQMVGEDHNPFNYYTSWQSTPHS
ncbi:Alpha/Beta hydrolase protein [Cubamyces lactineus]|nr:Alpha/Beta hydrolase protein [Cubamyces lactineus]